MAPACLIRVRPGLIAIAGILMALLLGGCSSHPPPLVLTEAEKFSAATLMEGDAAPPLQINEWVRGEPVTEFRRGTVYVVEFWAPWCGPCLAVMPRTSRLQDRTRGKVVVIGVATLDEMTTASEVRSLAQAGRHPMRFTVAIDDGDTTARRYRAAARAAGIPHSFVIDRDGRLAWHGHPIDVEPVVDAVLNGTWGLEEARREGMRRDEARLESAAVVRDYLAAVADKDVEAQLASAERGVRVPVKYMTAMSPPHWAWWTRVGCLVKLGLTEDARAAAEEAAQTLGVREEAYGMAQLATSIKPASLEDAARYADEALALVAAAETRGAGDEWDQYIAYAGRSEAATARIIAADIRASQDRWSEAAMLMRAAIEVWPDGDRFIPSKKQLKERLAGYEAKASAARADGGVGLSTTGSPGAP
jgi:thiol-disulfide isomerase/thioredoxin